MIEMQWVTKVVALCGYPGCCFTRERVLQYRVDPSNGLGQWSEWKEVPEVTQSEPQNGRTHD